MSIASSCSGRAGLLLILALASCTARLPDHGVVPPGDYVGHLEAREEDLRRRSYRVHIPPRQNAAALPVVLVLHGAFSNARGVEERSGFSQLADAEGFVAVYPNGYGLLGLLRHWNAGHCCGQARRLGLDDAAFLDEVLDDVAGHIAIDPQRVYVVGESNGAMLAHLYAALRSHRIAAAGAVIGTIGSGPPGNEERIPPPELPVPMVVVHGTADQAIPFEGGTSGRYPDVSWVSTADGATFWVTHNGAATTPAVTSLHAGRVVRSEWQGGEDAAPVVLYEVDDWPHLWPGPQSTARLAAGDALRDFDAASVVWQHLRAHRRTTP